MWENSVTVAASQPTVLNLGRAWSRKALLFLLVVTLHGVFTIVYLKRNMFLGYTVLQLLCIHNYGTCNVTFYYECLLLLLSTFRGMCALPNMAVLFFSLFSWFPVMLLRYVLNDSEMFPVAPIITGNTSVPHSTLSCISIARSFYCRILYASFLSHVCLPKLQRLLTCMFFFYYHGLCCLVYCSGWICRCSLVDYLVLLTYSMAQSPSWEANWFCS